MADGSVDTKKKLQRFRPQGILLLCLSLACWCFILSGCASPEQQQKQRVERLRSFCARVMTHVFDRNPQTIRESMAYLMREEAHEKAVDKLQALGLIPQSEIGVLQIIAESEQKKVSTKVDIKQVTALTEPDKPMITFLVKGSVSTSMSGQAPLTKEFAYKLTCRLIDDSYPQVMDVVPVAAPTVQKEQKKTPPPAKPRKRRRR